MVKHKNEKGSKHKNTSLKRRAVYHDNRISLGSGICFIVLGGVIGFFVLSSYFLTKKVIRNDVVTFGIQVKYRLKRLYPAYLVVIVIALLNSLWLGHMPWDVLLYILFMQNFAWRFPIGEISIGKMMAHTWTLCIEVWMGTIWMYLLMKIRREYWKCLCYIGIVFSVTWRLFIVINGYSRAWISVFPISYADIFALGTLLAINENRKRIVLRDFICGIFGIVAIGLTWIYLAVNNEKSIWGGYLLFGGSGYYLSNIFTVNIYLYIGLLFYTIISGLLRVSGVKKGVFQRLFSWIGSNSYELYLFHYPFLMILVQAGLWRKWYQNFAVCLFSAIAVTLIWRGREKILEKGQIKL